jgi:hypothetical protein
MANGPQRFELWLLHSFQTERNGDKLPSAFLRGHGEESRNFLVHLLASAFGTFDLPLFVFRKRKDDLKRSLAIFTVELITGH